MDFPELLKAISFPFTCSPCASGSSTVSMWFTNLWKTIGQYWSQGMDYSAHTYELLSSQIPCCAKVSEAVKSIFRH
jgi:hypothetical protein